MRYLSASEVAGRLAQKTGLTDEQVRALLQAQAELAYESAREGFQIPGLGVLIAVERSREIIANFGPDAGKRTTLPAKTVLRFHVAEAARAAVSGEQPASANVFSLELFKDGNIDVS